MRGRPPPRGFIKEQKGPYALLSVAGFAVGALVAAAVAAAVLALRRRRRGAGAGNGCSHPRLPVRPQLCLVQCSSPRLICPTYAVDQRRSSSPLVGAA